MRGQGRRARRMAGRRWASLVVPGVLLGALALPAAAEAHTVVPVAAGATPAALILQAAILAFREGLEAILILASLLGGLRAGGAPRRRAPLWWGALVSGLATVLTWLVARHLLAALAWWGDRLVAAVSLLAVGVLLLITNWFFHGAYWVRWLARFHRGRARLAGGAAGAGGGLALLGFASTYREGFESVLLAQPLTFAAGQRPVLLGLGLGTGAALLVGALILVAGARLPQKRLLVATGLLIGAVLVTLVGDTAAAMQAVGWLPAHAPGGLVLPAWAGHWFGLHPTTEGLLLQLAAATFAGGSYPLARYLRRREYVRPIARPALRIRLAGQACRAHTMAARLPGRLLGGAIKPLHVAVIVSMLLALPDGALLPVGQARVHRAAASGEISYQYDALGRLVAVVDPSGDTARYQYDAAGNLLSITRSGATQPMIVGFTPASGPVGTTVTIQGNGFGASPGQNVVTFANNHVATVTSASATELAVTVPSGAVTGAVSVTVSGNTATSATAFTVVSTSDAPTITSFSPAISAVDGTITISGTNFAATPTDNTVTINGVPLNILSGDAGTLVAKLPSVIGSGKITIAKAGGGQVTSGDELYVVPIHATADVARRAALGTPETFTLTADGRVALLLFDGVAGQRVSATRPGYCGPFSIHKPDGTTLASLGGCSAPDTFLEPVTLPISGVYSVLAAPPAAGSYTIGLYSVVDLSGTVAADGVAKTAAITAPGQNARYIFPGTAGQRVSLNRGGYCGQIAILAPDASTLGALGGCNFPDTFLDPVTLPMTGDYTVLLDPQWATTGNLTFSVYTVNDIAGAITPGTPLSAPLTTPGQVARYNFSGTAGQRVSLTRTPFCGTVAILKPDNETLAGIGGCNFPDTFIDATTLPSTGTYTVVADPGGATAGTYTIGLYDVSDYSGTIAADGVARTVPLLTPGQNGSLTFDGIAGQIISLARSPYCGTLTLRRPDGTTLAQLGGCNFPDTTIGNTTLPVTGTYTIVLDPGGATTGTMQVTLYYQGSGGGGTPGGQATYVATDTTTQGNWKGTYGGDGYNVIGDAASYPGYATVSASGYFAGAWANPTTDTRALQKVGANADRIAPYWASGGTFAIDVLITDGQQHRLAVYALDWDSYGPRTATIEVLDATTNAVLDTRTLTAFTGGTYLVWTIGGHVTIRVTNTNPGRNAVISGLFFGPAGAPPPLATATYVATDTVTQGAWKGTYGAAGYNVLGDASSYPGGVSVMPSGQSAYTWAASTTAAPALQKVASSSDRIASCWYSGGSFDLLLDLGATPRRVALYALDWDAYGPRTETVQVLDAATNAVLDTRTLTAFTDGTYLVWTLGGLVRIRVTNTNPGRNAVISGLFFDPAPSGQAPAGPTAILPGGQPGSPHAGGQLALPDIPPLPTPGALVVGAAGAGTSSSRGAGQAASPPADDDNDDERWKPDDRQTGQGKPWTSGQPDHPNERQDLPLAREGVTALAGQVLALTGRPLAGVTLRIDNRVAKSDKQGRFLLQPLTPGHHELVIDGRTANQGKREYGVFVSGINLVPGKTTILPHTIWLVPLDTKDTVTIDAPTKREVVLTTPLVPGLEVRLPAGTTLKDQDGRVVRELGITPIPLDRSPFPLPLGQTAPPIFFTVQAGGGGAIVALSQGARIVYPNYTHLAPGTRADFWQYEPDGDGWEVYGHGQVSADGRQVAPDPGVAVTMLYGAMFGTGRQPPSQAPCQKCAPAGDPVDTGTGLFVLDEVDLTLPDAMPLVLGRTYQPGNTTSGPFGVGTTHPYETYIWSANQYQEADLILPDGSRVHYVRISPGTGWTDAVFEAQATPTRYLKSRITWNGNGWDLTLRDGTVLVQGENAPMQGWRDRNGNQITITRTDGPRGNIVQLTTSNGRWIAFRYDGSNRITQATDNTGRVVTYDYDTSGRLIKVTDPAGGVHQYTYNSNGRMETLKDARAITFLTNEYDTNGRVTKQTQADGTYFLFAYTLDTNGKVTVTEVTDPRGTIRRTTFNTAGYPLTDTIGYGTSSAQTTNYVRDATTNLVLGVTDQTGRKTAYTYDGFGNVLTVTRLADTPQAVTITMTYGTYDQVASVTDPLSRTTTYAYDSKGNLTAVAAPLGRTTTFTYNAAGQVLTVTDPLNHTATYAYSHGVLVSTSDPLGRQATYLTDGAGRRRSVTDPLGFVTRADYDLLNRPTSVTNALGGVIGFTYDANGNRLTLSDPLNRTTTYTYDPMDRVTARQDPLLHGETYTYDNGGLLETFTDRKGQVTTYTYDVLGRLTKVQYDDASTVTYIYDSANRVTQAVDSANGTITWAYDDLDRVTQETTSQGTVFYAYGVTGRLTTVTVQGQAAITFTYDNADRITQIAQGTWVTTYTYDAADRVTSQTFPNGILATYGYDNANRLTSIAYTRGPLAIGDLTYSYDANGRVATMGGSLARVALPAATTATATYNANHQLVGWNGTTLTYDLNGNLTGDGTSTYTWNARNQLVGISGGASAGFTYDVAGRRVTKTLGGTTTTNLLSGNSVVQEQQGGSPMANRVLGPGTDQFVSRTDGTGGRTPLTDAQGSVLALADENGAVKTEYTYGPFGATTTSGEASGNARACYALSVSRATKRASSRMAKARKCRPLRTSGRRS